MSLQSIISSALYKTLSPSLSKAFSAEFELDEETVTKFVNDFLQKQLATKVKRIGKPSGWILFGKTNRKSVSEAHPELNFGQVTKELGKQWSALSDAEKQDYNNRAAAGVDGGVDAGGATKTSTGKSVKKSSTKKTVQTKKPVQSKKSVKK